MKLIKLFVAYYFARLETKRNVKLIIDEIRSDSGNIERAEGGPVHLRASTSSSKANGSTPYAIPTLPG